MAICDFCGQEMLQVDTCEWNEVVEFPDGVSLPSLPFKSEFMGEICCHDCYVLPGMRHHPGCDMEECPRCLGQLISCGCLDEKED